jgi:hypothetical protein
MKWIVRFITLVMLGAAIGVPFFIKNKSGQPMLALPTVDDLTPDLAKNTPLSDSGEQVFYKWKDKEGVWHFGDEIPPEVTHVIAVTVNPNANIMKSLPKEAVKPTEMPEKVYPPSESGYKPPSSKDDALTLDRALNIVNDAHAVRQMMESRNQAIEGGSGDK